MHCSRQTHTFDSIGNRRLCPFQQAPQPVLGHHQLCRRPITQNASCFCPFCISYFLACCRLSSISIPTIYCYCQGARFIWRWLTRQDILVSMESQRYAIQNRSIDTWKYVPYYVRITQLSMRNDSRIPV